MDGGEVGNRWESGRKGRRAAEEYGYQWGCECGTEWELMKEGLNALLAFTFAIRKFIAGVRCKER